GFCVIASRLGAVVIVLGTLIFSLRLIGREEAELSATQGETYQKFLVTVPKLIPSLMPRLPAGGSKPHWGQPLLGDGFFYGFAAAMLAFVLTLNFKWFGITMLASMSLYFVSRLLLAKSSVR